MMLSVNSISLRISTMPPHARGRRELETIARELKHDDLYRDVLVQELETVLAREDWSRS